MATRSVVASKDNTSYQNFGNADARQRGRGQNDRLIAGRLTLDADLRVRSFLFFDLTDFWDNVEKVTSATIDLVVAGGGDLSTGNTGRLAVQRLTSNFTEGSSTSFNSDDYRWPSSSTSVTPATDVGAGNPDDAFSLDVMNVLRALAPKRVTFEGLGAGEAKENKGFLIKGAPESAASAAAQFWSRHVATAGKRPTLTIIYEPINTAPEAGLTSPVGNVSANFFFEGTFTDVDPNDGMTSVEVEVKKQSDAWSEPVLTVKRSLADISGVWTLSSFDSSTLKRDIPYHARARVFDKDNKESEWTDNVAFTIVADAPTATANLVESETTVGLVLTGQFTVDDLTDAVRFDVQVGLGLDTLSPNIIWTYSYPPTLTERMNNEIRAIYAGPALSATSYDWRFRVHDSLGGISDWSLETLTISLDPDPDEEDYTNTTGYSNTMPAQRILIREMDAQNRGPSRVIAIIEDFHNLGISWYASAPGEIYFTLSTEHPQVSLIEPMTTHYEFQQYRNGKWASLAHGLIRDFDANDNDVVFYGTDYLGLLSWSVEAAKQTVQNPKRSIPTKVTGTDGSRYLKKTIRQIIIDQLDRARRQDPNSPVKFIETGRVDSYSTRVTIYASFAERLSFIRSLIDSHKGSQANGEERRSRVRVRYNPAAGNGTGRFQFEALDGVGSDRDNLKLEYGSLIQGYRVIALDDFATQIYGIGKVPNATLPYFSSVDAPGISLEEWGAIGRANFWTDIVDQQDLTRRARALGTRMSRIGKRIALGLRVSGIDVFDGYDLLDSFPVSIEDGVVSTSQYGSGYWTLWGMEYRVYPDEHDEVTFILRPKGDTSPIDADLIPSNPINYSAEWTWGNGAP